MTWYNQISRPFQNPFPEVTIILISKIFFWIRNVLFYKDFFLLNLELILEHLKLYLQCTPHLFRNDPFSDIFNRLFSCLLDLHSYACINDQICQLMIEMSINSYSCEWVCLKKIKKNLFFVKFCFSWEWDWPKIWLSVKK